MYTIRTAAKKLNKSEQYIRKCVREGKIETELNPIKAGSVTMRHEISEAELERFAKRTSNRSSREDGRNKYVAYLSQSEFKAVTELLRANKLTEVANLITRANPSKNS